MKIFRLVTELIPKPDLLIYLKASVPTLILSQIPQGAARVRDEYRRAKHLKRLNDNYNNWMETTYTEGDVLVVDKQP